MSPFYGDTASCTVNGRVQVSEFPTVVGLVKAGQASGRAAQNVAADANAMDLRPPSTGGPLVVVCGLHGGAGTSTLAYALAATVSESSSSDVLLAETDGSCGDVARLTGVVSPLGLSGLAVEFAAGRPPRDGAFVRAGRLRVVASDDALPVHSGEGAVTALLEAARPLHGLLVVDAGTWRSSGARELLSVASHVVWVMAARPDTADTARRVLARWSSVPARQALVARGSPGCRRATKALTELADGTCDRLVLWEDSPTPVDLGDRRLLGSLSGLRGWLDS